MKISARVQRRRRRRRRQTAIARPKNESETKKGDNNAERRKKSTSSPNHTLLYRLIERSNFTGRDEVEEEPKTERVSLQLENEIGVQKSRLTMENLSRRKEMTGE